MRLPHWIPGPLKPAVWILIILIGVPSILVLTLVEVFGILGDLWGGDPTYQLHSCRFATLGKAGQVAFWPEGIHPISNVNEGLATYFECPDSGGMASREDSMEPFIFGSSVSGGFVDVAGNKHPLTRWRVVSSTRFSSGLAPVQDPFTGLFCFVDSNGVQRIPQSFHAAQAFSDGLAAVSVEPLSANNLSHQEHGKWGYIDTTGKMIIKPHFCMIGDFSAGRALVRSLEDSRSVLVIDKAGKTVFRSSFDELSPYANDGIAVFKMKKEDSSMFDRNRCGLVDVNGKILFQGRLFESFSDGLGLSMGRGGTYFADKCGKRVISQMYDPHFSSLSVFGDGLCAIAIGGMQIGHRKYAPYVPRVEFINRLGQIQTWDLPGRTIVAAYPFNHGYTVVKTFIAKQEL